MTDQNRPARTRDGLYLTTVREIDGQRVADIYAAGETREVRITWDGPNGRLDTDSVFLAQKAGGKTWRCAISLWPDSEHEGQHHYHHGQSFMNRAGYTITAWNDEKWRATRSQHNSTGGWAPRTK